MSIREWLEEAPERRCAVSLARVQEAEARGNFKAMKEGELPCDPAHLAPFFAIDSDCFAVWSRLHPALKMLADFIKMFGRFRGCECTLNLNDWQIDLDAQRLFGRDFLCFEWHGGEE